MVQDVIIEAVLRKQVALVVDGVDRPVIPKLLRAQHQHAVIAQFVIFDDGQRFKSLTETNTVGDDAAVVLLQLVDCAQYTVLLELVKLVPDKGVLEAGLCLNDAVFVDVIEEVFKNVVERQEIDEVARLIGGDELQLLKELFLDVSGLGGIHPDRVKPGQ